MRKGGFIPKEQMEAVGKVCPAPELVLSLWLQLHTGGQEGPFRPGEPHMSLRVGRAPGAAACGSPLCRHRLLCSFLLPVWLQFGLADHVLAWPLSPGEPLGALRSAPSLPSGPPTGWPWLSNASGGGLCLLQPDSLGPG